MCLSTSSGRKRKYEDAAAVAAGLKPPSQPRDVFGRPTQATAAPMLHSVSGSSGSSHVPKPGFPTSQGSIMPRPLSATIPPLGGGSRPSPAGASLSLTSSTLTTQQQQVLQPSTAAAAVGGVPPAAATPSDQQQQPPGNFMLLTLKKMENAHLNIHTHTQQPVVDKEQWQAENHKPPPVGTAAAGEVMNNHNKADGTTTTTVAGGGGTVSATAMEVVVEDDDGPGSVWPSVEERRKMMDETITRIKADIEVLRKEGQSMRQADKEDAVVPSVTVHLVLMRFP